MHLVLVLLGLLASAFAATAPIDFIEPTVVPDEGVYEKCTARCTGYAMVNPTYVQPCLASCNLHLGKKIEETLMRMAAVTEGAPVTSGDYRTLYTNGLMLQNQLVSLRRAVQQQQAVPPANLFGGIFPNLGFFPPPNQGLQPMPFAAPAQPQFPGILTQITETITNLLNQVIKRQQEILQMIIGCNCSSTATPPAPAVPAVPILVKGGIIDLIAPENVTPAVPVTYPRVPTKEPEVGVIYSRETIKEPVAPVAYPAGVPVEAVPVVLDKVTEIPIKVPVVVDKVTEIPIKVPDTDLKVPEIRIHKDVPKKV